MNRNRVSPIKRLDYSKSVLDRLGVFSTVSDDGTLKIYVDKKHGGKNTQQFKQSFIYIMRLLTNNGDLDIQCLEYPNMVGIAVESFLRAQDLYWREDGVNTVFLDRALLEPMVLPGGPERRKNINNKLNIELLVKPLIPIDVPEYTIKYDSLFSSSEEIMTMPARIWTQVDLTLKYTDFIKLNKGV